MLTKQAQEEMYTTYYNQGVELALGQIKVAGKTKEVIKKMIQVPSAALGGIGIMGMLESIPPDTMEKIVNTHSQSGRDAIFSALGLGGAAGYAASGKAVDLADAGIQKLLKKMKK